MSRFNEYDGDEDFPNAWALWEKRAQLALEGKRGRKALADLREALLALPEKRLIARALCTVGLPAKVAALPLDDYGRRDLLILDADEGEGVCAIGAYVWHQKVKAGMTPDEAFAALPMVADFDGDADYETARIGRDAGLTYTLAWELAARNDETNAHLTPAERYDEFLRWIDQQLARPPLARAPRRVRRVRRGKSLPVAPETLGL